MIGFLDLDLESDMDTGLWYTRILNFGPLLILKVQRTSSFGALKDAGGSWV